MEEIMEYNRTNYIPVSDEEARSSVFLELKHYCLQLLDLLQNPKKNPSSLSQLLHFLRRSPPDALQPFFDYTLFPLLLLLDAAVNCRSPPKIHSEERSVMFDVPKTPHKVSDTVAEAVLQCLEVLLTKCHLGSVDQMVVMLKKLTYGALLSPSEAAEEFREGLISGWPTLLERRDLESPLTRIPNYDSEPEECLLAFLQSQAASAVVGHWLSLLLKAADIEAARGHRGSAQLRVEAFMTLRMLVAKVGTADALAFFLPGVVSQIGKVLHVSKRMISGAAGSVDATEQAIRSLAEILMIVLDDDANISSLSVSIDDVTGLQSNKDKSPLSFLEELRQLPLKTQDQGECAVTDSRGEAVDCSTPESDVKGKGSINSGGVIGSLHVNRTKDWVVKTSAHVDKLLSATFPHLCIHPAQKVRQGLLAAIQGLLSKCCFTLEESRLMLLECLCVLVSDDSEEVSAPAQAFFGYLLSSSGKRHIENDIAVIFNRLIQKLPKVVLGSEESLALSHAKKLLAIIYFSGPQLVAQHLFQSSVTAARFLDVFALCLSHNSVCAGSLDKVISARPSSTGYLRSIAEMKPNICFSNDNMNIMDAEGSKFPGIQNHRAHNLLENVQNEYELPHMPPWFSNVGSQKLYQALAGILRLVGLSLFADSRGEGSLSVITDIPLGYLRKLVAEVRTKEYSKESWQSWHQRTGSGQLVRQASTAACILNEMVFGLSDQAVDPFARMFQKSRLRWGEMEKYDAGCDDNQPFKLEQAVPDKFVWKVIIDGIAIFNVCLGKDFSSSGFLHLSLYVLLENLICSNFQIRRSSDAALHIISATFGYPTVGHLVLANSDYVIDSICRQLRHLDLNPHVPNVLAAMLSYIGVAHKILPLLEEPMRSVSLELEILGRHQHPDLTIPFLKAVAEIAKASNLEAGSLPNQAESYSKHVKSKLSDVERKARKDSGLSNSHRDKDIDMAPVESETEVDAYSIDDLQIDQWESALLKLNDSKRYRRTVGSIAGSCIMAATPLLASVNQRACLVALDIVEDGIMALANIEAAYRHEKETKEAVEHVFQLCGFHNLRDSLDAAEDGTEENRLLPAMNKIWPFLVACIQNKNLVAVRRCSSVISNVVQICGGDFFSRRFHSDGVHFWKLLNTSPFQKKHISKEERMPLQLPYRSTSMSSEEPMAEISDLKGQVAVLNMIADLSKNKRSGSALEAVLKRVCGLVVGIACSGVIGLRDASINALTGLASLDPDLIWLLLADVYYSLKKTDMPMPPSGDLPEISQILPPPSSPKGYLYVKYGGQSYGFNIDISSVEIVFKNLNSKVFTTQMYS
ncbi:unnamed protein product [Ilex paraguariensis]|uniref:ARM repeat superfamily protein n=1 Tax=Ilex paraguariensis TaxID=185542 RepID=A0ABC8T8C8_9AQUA